MSRARTRRERWALWLVVSVGQLAACSPGNGIEVSAESFAAEGHQWPFTVERGRIGCEASFPYFESGGVRYALNGRARAKWSYVEPLLEIDEESWRMYRQVDPHGYVPKVDPKDVREEALKLCEGTE